MQSNKLRLLKYLRGYRFMAYISPLFKFLEAAFELIVPLFLARVIDIGIVSKDVPYIVKNCVYMGLLAFAGITFSLLCQRFATVSSVGYGGKMRSALYKHINSLSYSDIDKMNSSRLINNLTIDTVNSQNALGLFLRLVTRAPFLAGGSIVLAFFISARLSLIFLAAVAIIGALIFLIMRFSIPRLMKVNTQTDTVTRLVKENISGTRVIRAYVREQKTEEDFAAENEKLRDAFVRVNKILTLGNPLCFLFINLAVVLVVYMGGFTGTQSVSAGDLVALVNYFTQSLLAILVIIQLTVVFSRSMASNKRIREVFALQKEDLNENGLTEFDDAQTAVEYEGVSFGYAGDKNIIEDISFSLPAGGKAGINGSTGSGKTTLVSLLPKFYSPRSGSIKIFGRDINEYNTEFLRQKIKIAESTPTLFSGTVRENVRAGGNATDAEIKEAIRLACAESFAGDLEKQISANGANLSKGQRQRLSIARALAANPSILILDDALSALDNVTANAVITNIFARGVTTIAVTRSEKILKECDVTLCSDSFV